MRYDTVNNESDNFYKIEENYVTENLKKLLDKLEKHKNVLLCARGESRYFNRFITNKNLGKIFVVGEKARIYNQEIESKVQKYYHTRTDKDTLKKNIKELVSEINEQIKNNPHKTVPLKGKISDDSLNKLLNNEDNLYQTKIVLLSFLHNSYKNKEFNTKTPFISLTHGENKINTAKNFALKCDNNGNCKKKNGYIFLYGLPCRKIDINKEYVITKDLRNILENLGIYDFKDFYNEIMLVNGLYPHYLLGIYKLTDYKITKFTINPSLYELLKNNENLDKIAELFTNDGLNINQENFISIAEELGYNTYFYKINNKTYIVTI